LSPHALFFLFTTLHAGLFSLPSFYAPEMSFSLALFVLHFRNASLLFFNRFFQGRTCLRVMFLFSGIGARTWSPPFSTRTAPFLFFPFVPSRQPLLLSCEPWPCPLPRRSPPVLETSRGFFLTSSSSSVIFVSPFFLKANRVVLEGTFFFRRS